MGTRWRTLILAGSAARLAYGLGAVVAPGWMAGRAAPTVHDADARMNLRGFGGAQSAIAIFTAAASRDAVRAAAAVRLNALVDGCDTAVSLLERRDRGEVDRLVAGGLALNVAGLGWWLACGALLRRAGS